MSSTVDKFSPNMTGISSSFRGVLLDASGVFWGGEECCVLPGAKETMENLVSKGKVVGILSNTTQLANKMIHKLHQHGLIQGQHFHFLITSGEVARHIFLNEKLPFKTPNNTFWLFGDPHPRYSSHEAIFQNTCYKETHIQEEADFIYIAIPHINGEDQIDPDVFRANIQKLNSKKLPMICPNPDQFAHEGKPSRAVVRQGSIARLYEEIGGQVFYIGKPHREAYAMAMSNFEKHGDMSPSEILMVGDTPETDVRGARLFGMPSVLVTQTGIMADRIAQNGLDNALTTLASEDVPEYFIERFTDVL